MIKQTKTHFLFYTLMLSILFITVLINKIIIWKKKLGQNLIQIKDILNPNQFDSIFYNFIYNQIEQLFMLPNNKKNKQYFQDYIGYQQKQYQIFYMKRRQQYCRANFLYVLLNNKEKFFNSLNLFTDLNNKNKLRKTLKQNFNLLNQQARKHTHYTQSLIKQLQKQDWNPYIKLIFTNNNMLYNQKIGQSFFCPFQSSNFIPGSSFLHRTDQIYDSLTEFDKEENNQICFNVNKFLINSFWLYDQSECKQFFQIISSKKFLQQNNQKIIYLIWNVEDAIVEYLDNSELRKLNKQYKYGKMCGTIKKKIIIQDYIKDQVKYKDQRKFVLRTYLIISSTSPLYVLFYQGEAHLERVSKDQTFENSQIKIEQLNEYLIKENLWKENTLQNIQTKIQQYLTFLIMLNKNKLYQDHRFFQVIAFDFIVNKKNEVYLFNQISNPYFNQNNSWFVLKILKLQNQIINITSNQIINQVELIKGEMYKDLANRQQLKIEYLEEIFLSINKKQYFKTFKSNLLQQIKKSDQLKQLYQRQSDFKVLFSDSLQIEDLNSILNGNCQYIKIKQ